MIEESDAHGIQNIGFSFFMSSRCKKFLSIHYNETEKILPPRKRDTYPMV